MENISTMFKTVAGGIGFFVSYMVDGLGLAFTVLIGMMLLDFVTGFIASHLNGEASSATGMKGLLKKVYVLLLIGAVYLLQSVVEIAEFAGDGITVAFILVEFLSIVENAGRSGVPMPEKLKDGIAVLRGNK